MRAPRASTSFRTLGSLASKSSSLVGPTIVTTQNSVPIGTLFCTERDWAAHACLRRNQKFVLLCMMSFKQPIYNLPTPACSVALHPKPRHAQPASNFAHSSALVLLRSRSRVPAPPVHPPNSASTLQLFSFPPCPCLPLRSSIAALA